MKAKTDTDKKSNFVLLDSIPEESESPIPDQSIDQNDLLFYAFKRHGKKTSHLVIKGALSEDIISYITDSSPEVYNMLEKWLEKDSLYIDLEKGKVWSTKRAVIHEEILALVEAIGTIDISPKRHISIPPSSDIASVILCGGKGSRMRSKDLHKVCFPIAGKLAASRLIDQLESAGISEHIVVVGEKGKQVIDEITDIHDGIAYVYQINQNGTGNAAKQAAYLLRSQGYEGTILVVPGDKVFEESALKRLCKTFKDSEADLALMTADKKFWPDAGRILFNRKGHPIDIVEKRDIQKMILSKKLLEIKRSNPGVSSKSLLREILNDVPDISRARIMFPGIIERLENNTNLSLADLEEMLPENRTSYAIRNGNEILNFSGDELEYATPVTNAAVYLFSADAFYKSVFSIRSDNAQKEEYLTDVVRILAEDTEKPWKIIPVPVKDQYEVMSYNNPEELLKIEEYYARKESISASVERSCERIHVTQRKHSLRPIEEWKRIIEEFGPDIRSSFREIYGDNEDIFTERRKVYLQALVKFTKVYGKNNSVIIARSPGRVNLMGRHVEHRGGFTNYMTINREAILVAGIREDDIVEIHNVDSRQF
ncbi:MAG: NTP transferase domain-containing protein, partial [Candidatus Latescibacteria bacterium]|nr:NTP transferase domain-containing protein [Candidatus Latescibacterota bacterium]